jgi:hypothetical protein
MSKPRLEVTARITPDGKPFTVTGRDAFALDELLSAGLSGCTPISRPAPRWSAYIHALRTERGLNIETVTEPHAGLFAGHHAKYILRSPVEIISRNDREELARAA